MSADPETTRIVRSWLDEGVTQLPDRVLDAVLDELPATPQRRATWWPARRLSARSTTLKFGLAAVVAAVVVLIGINTFGTSNTNVGGPGSDTPTPTPEASITEPSPSVDRSLPEGEHTIWAEADGSRRITVTIPAPGWYGERGGGILGNVPEEENFAPEDAWMIGPFGGDIYVPADPCEWSTTMPDTPATTVEEVVAAVRGQASRDASEPVDITVDGYVGKSITLHVPEDANFGECDRNQISSGAEFCTLTQDNPAVCHRYHQFPGQIDELWIVDVNGEVAVIDATWGDETPAEALAELRAILDSMAFEGY